MKVKHTATKGSPTHAHVIKVVERFGKKATFTHEQKPHRIVGAEPRNEHQFDLILETLI